MIYTTINLHKRFFFHKINKNTKAKKTSDEMFYIFAGMTLLTPDSKLGNS